MKKSRRCPQCKEPVDSEKMLELSTNFQSDSIDPSDYPNHFENDFDELKANFEKMNLKSMQDKIKECQSYAVEMEKTVDHLFQPESLITSQRMQTLVNLEEDLEKLKKENQDLHQEIEDLNDAKTFLTFCQDEAENLLCLHDGKKYLKNEKSIPYKMALYCTAVKSRFENEKKIIKELEHQILDLHERLNVTEQNVQHVKSINDSYDSRVKSTRSNIAKLLQQNLDVIPTSALHDDFADDSNEFPECPDPVLGINYQASGKNKVEIALLDPDMDQPLPIDQQIQGDRECSSVLGYIKSDGDMSVIVGPQRYKNGSIPKLRFILT
ncbi:hypothetical protein TNCT_344901 [Trichonephila clavata]|uniref:Uncharacterized protein n=1 Tax=Trichonephila clavata TaxID=2740835 RepID=A0A8X6KUJ2_TRICU|nr:hypothetical protein TNCT_344901 [Trichonephila clavata]